MANTLTASDIQKLLEHLEKIEELTGLLRRAHMEVPYETVYGAVGAAICIREKLLRASLTDVVVVRETEMAA